MPTPRRYWYILRRFGLPGGGAGRKRGAGRRNAAGIKRINPEWVELAAHASYARLSGGVRLAACR
ncbi:MAG: hypothetical protein PHR35_06770 [Kiritimatiellae bacterium]|nr:hypothetical protein [Kiritimatiellia bacterium]